MSSRFSVFRYFSVLCVFFPVFSVFCAYFVKTILKTILKTKMCDPMKTKNDVTEKSPVRIADEPFFIGEIPLPLVIVSSGKRKKTISYSVENRKVSAEDGIGSGLYILTRVPSGTPESEIRDILSKPHVGEVLTKTYRKRLSDLKQIAESDENIFTDGSYLLFNGDRFLLSVSHFPISDRRRKPYAEIEKNGDVFRAAVYHNRQVSPEDEKRLIADSYRAFLKERGEILFQARADFWFRIYRDAGLIVCEPKSVTAETSKRRWGCCSNDNRIRINYLLAEMKTPLIDYVIIHELCHIRFKNHSRDFWNLVSYQCPDYKNKRKKVNENSSRVFF